MDVSSESDFIGDECAQEAEDNTGGVSENKENIENAEESILPLVQRMRMPGQPDLPPSSRRFGFINSNSSCYMDSVLAALLLPDYGDIVKHALQPLSDDQGGNLSRSSFNNTNHLKRRLLDERHHFLAARHGWVASSLRLFLQQMSSHSRASTGDARAAFFQSSRPQSAVDFLRHLLDMLCIGDSICTFQTSTTLMTRRPETEQHKGDMVNLVRLWMQTPICQRWNSANAHLLTDPDDVCERKALQNDTSSTAALVINTSGDRRRISPPERTSIFLCQLTPTTPTDKNRVLIYKQLVPHLEIVGDPSDGYMGNITSKLLATKLIDAPLLIFEVSRLVTDFDPVRRQVVETKVVTPVNFGDFNEKSQQWQIKICSKWYHLVAVVCHLGSSVSDGHYVAFVKHEDDDCWYFHDDTLRNGELIKVFSKDLTASNLPPPHLCGELFFYVPCEVCYDAR